MSRIINNRHPQWVKPPPEVKRRIMEEKRMAERNAYEERQAQKRAAEEAREVKLDEIINGIADLLQNRKKIRSVRDKDGDLRWEIW